jgi:hypothetical protein
MKPPALAVGLLGLALLGLSDGAGAQTAAFEARVGVAWHGDTVCSVLSARSRGPWIASGAVDLILDNLKRSCLDILLVYDYQGQQVTHEGESSPFARLRIEAGHSIMIGGFHSELTAGAGLLPTYIDYGVDRSDLSWEPWYGATLTVRLPGSRTGVQLELGRHRLTQRYYTVDTRALVDEIHRWRPLTRLGVTFPL